ncbi:MAG: helix-turn-helix transcriptional regulator [Bacteroidota bacterium]
MPLDEIGQRIRHVRKNHNLNQFDFAEAIGVSRRVVQRMEAGRTSPRKSTIDSICEVFSINKDWLNYKAGTMSGHVEWGLPFKTLTFELDDNVIRLGQQGQYLVIESENRSLSAMAKDGRVYISVLAEPA